MINKYWIPDQVRYDKALDAKGFFMMAKKITAEISKPRSLRVLMVDDSEDDALLIIRELKKGGYNPVYERVETPAAMKKALSQKQWDIILCDYKMPKFSGLQAIAVLKETNIDIPLIIVSGTIGEEVAVDCMRLGAQDYIMKGNLLRLAPAVEREIAEAKTRAGHRRAEEEKQLLEERLQHAEKMEALGLLAGGVAHDLNNVLGVVVGFAELALRGVDKSSSLRRDLENVMRGGLKAAAIVDDLLTLARRGVPGRSILNLNQIIADCQKSPEFDNLTFQHPKVQIKTDLDSDLLNISGSSVHLAKTLYNLVSNACEAMPKGGIVTIKTNNQYLDKPIYGYDKIHDGDYVVLSLSDTGEGISELDMKRIFEPFYTKKIMGRSGTGLGLAVVWGTVKDHQGYINVLSEGGKGSTFTLYFPVTREDIPAEAATIAISEYMGSGESILVVDDVKEQRDLATGMLSDLNYNVSCVQSGEEAVSYLKDHKVDLIVLDMLMDPGMDGLDTYKSVLKINPKQKAIIVSGFSESDRVHDAQGLGAGEYVKKPYIIEKLGMAVRNELARTA
jgi:signal transduction histidine kinase